jgi:hypothetical protein
VEFLTTESYAPVLTKTLIVQQFRYKPDFKPDQVMDPRATEQTKEAVMVSFFNRINRLSTTCPSDNGRRFFESWSKEIARAAQC